MLLEEVICSCDEQQVFPSQEQLYHAARESLRKNDKLFFSFLLWCTSEWYNVWMQKMKGGTWFCPDTYIWFWKSCPLDSGIRCVEEMFKGAEEFFIKDYNNICNLICNKHTVQNDFAVQFKVYPTKLVK